MKHGVTLLTLIAMLLFSLVVVQRPANAAASVNSCSIMTIHTVVKAGVIYYAPRAGSTTSFRLTPGQRFFVCTNPIPVLDKQWTKFFMAAKAPMLYVPAGTFN